jgi:hypothetical protein
MFLRAIRLVKEVYDWISFSEQAFSWLGLAQRAAAVAAGAAVVAAPIVVATKPWQPAPAAPATVTAPAVPGTPGAPVPISSSDIEKQIDKISKENFYSKSFLIQPENRTLLDKILGLCKSTNRIPAGQCDIGDQAFSKIKRDQEMEAYKKAIQKIRREEDQRPPTVLKIPGESK